MQIYKVNNFIKKEIIAQMSSCEFYEIIHSTFLKEPFGRLLLHKHSFCLLFHQDHLFFQKGCHTYFPAKYFLLLIYRIGTRVSSMFQNLTQASIFNPVEHAQWSFLSKIIWNLKLLSIFAKKLPGRCSTRFQKRFCKQLLKDVVELKTKTWEISITLANFLHWPQISKKFDLGKSLT